jgi:hypothetical protein
MSTIRSAQSSTGTTEGCFLYSRSSVRAAFFLTNVVDVLNSQILLDALDGVEDLRADHCSKYTVA